MKLAFVVQRYGTDIAGGSEAHCRELAEHLTGRHDITVLTTCARDYVTWRNAMPAGESRVNGIRVIRFPVAHTRRRAAFADLSDEVFDGSATIERQHAWFLENGPHVPALLDHLREHGREYDAVLFWTFRYYPSYFGVPLVAERAILVPTAEEDPAIGMNVLEEFFRTPAGYLFMTPEEQALVAARAGEAPARAEVIGIGLDPTADADITTLAPLGLPAEFVLYLGRVDKNKGCETLLEYFQDYLADGGTATLVLAGPAKMQIPVHPQIRALGYVSDAVRSALLASARALVVPSPYESLSIVLLEAWSAGVPAIVNARCKVLKGQVARADGGLHYLSSREFREAIAFLLSHPRERDALGRQGRAYVEREYRWPVVIERVERLLARVTARH